MYMAWLAQVALASVLKLSGEQSTIAFGSGSSEAYLTAHCGDVQGPGVVDFSPRGTLNAAAYSWPPTPNVTAEFMGVPVSCVDVAARDPCVAHDQSFRRALFYLKFSGAGGETTVGPVYAFLQPHTLPDAKTIVSARATWPFPDLNAIIAASGYTGDGSIVPLNMSVVFYQPSGPHSLALPFRGVDGDEQLRLEHLPMPPSLPPPPVPPSPVSPPNSEIYIIRVWGAGGGSASGSYYCGGFGGGGGGYTALAIGTVPYTGIAGQTLTIVVGEGGKAPSTRGIRSYGGGGAVTYQANNHGGNGGGYSGVFLGSATQANAIVIAGG